MVFWILGAVHGVEDDGASTVVRLATLGAASCDDEVRTEPLRTPARFGELRRGDLRRFWGRGGVRLGGKERGGCGLPKEEERRRGGSAGGVGRGRGAGYCDAVVEAEIGEGEADRWGRLVSEREERKEGCGLDSPAGPDSAQLGRVPLFFCSFSFSFICFLF